MYVPVNMQDKSFPLLSWSEFGQGIKKELRLVRAWEKEQIC